MSSENATSVPNNDKILGGFSIEELVDALRKLEEFHVDYTIYRFTTHWKVTLCTPPVECMGRLLLMKSVPGDDLVSALKICLENKQGSDSNDQSAKIWKMTDDECWAEIMRKS